MRFLAREPIVDLLFDELSRSGATALAVIEEEPEVSALYRFIQVRVGEHNVRALSAQLQCDSLQIGFRGSFHNQMTHFGGAGERHFVHVHMTGDSGAGRGTKSRQQVDHSFRKSRLHDQFPDAQRGKRRLLCRLHHNGVSGGQRRSEFPCLHQHGKVPGNDLSDHADGFMPGVAEVVAVNGDGLPLNLVGPPREVTVTSNRRGDIDGFRHGNRLAVIQGFETCKPVGMLFDQVGEAVE